jgi:hypothetical protein
MASLLQRAARMLERGLRETAAEVVSYHREGRVATLTQAIPGRRPDHAEPSNAGNTVEGEMDWVLAASDLDFDGWPVEPEKGDELWWPQENGTTRVYRVLPSGEKCYRVADQLGVMLRVFTKFDRVE